MKNDSLMHDLNLIEKTYKIVDGIMTCMDDIAESAERLQKAFKKSEKDSAELEKHQDETSSKVLEKNISDKTKAKVVENLVSKKAADNISKKAALSKKAKLAGKTCASAIAKITAA